MKRIQIAFAILILELASISSLNRCPPEEAIRPCICEGNSNAEEHIRSISCRGNISLPHLTSILRNKLCDRHIVNFRLDVSNISYLPSNLFFKVTVEDIRITSTNISHFTQAGRSAFFGLEKDLKSLSMRKCHLVDKLQWQKIGDLEALTSLDLSENDLTGVPHQWFQYSPRNLRQLYLRANKITDVSPQAFASMYRLLYLDLSENYISTLQRNSFPFPGNSIIFLKLSYNDLSFLPEDFFLEMYGLRRLYLDHNHFETLEEKVWTPIWGELNTLDVLDNNLKCDCNMHWMAQLIPMEHLEGSCGPGSALAHRKLASLWPWDFNCNFTTS